MALAPIIKANAHLISAGTAPQAPGVHTPNYDEERESLRIADERRHAQDLEGREQASLLATERDVTNAKLRALLGERLPRVPIRPAAPASAAPRYRGGANAPAPTPVPIATSAEAPQADALSALTPSVGGPNGKDLQDTGKSSDPFALLAQLDRSLSGEKSVLPPGPLSDQARDIMSSVRDALAQKKIDGAGLSMDQSGDLFAKFMEALSQRPTQPVVPTPGANSVQPGTADTMRPVQGFWGGGFTRRLGNNSLPQTFAPFESSALDSYEDSIYGLVGMLV